MIRSYCYKSTFLFLAPNYITDMRTKSKIAHYHMRNSEYGTGMDIQLNHLSNSFSALLKMGIGALIGYYIHKLTRSGRLR